MRKAACILMLFLGIISISYSVPSSMLYQGRLKSGSTVVNGPVSMSFKLYSDLTSTAIDALLWSTPNLTVSVNEGIYNVQLGDSNNPLLPNVFNGDSVYIELTVSGDVLSPRARVHSVGYALQAAISNTANYALTANLAVISDLALTANYALTANLALNAQKLNNQEASYYQNADNVNSGTLANSRLDPDLQVLASGVISANNSAPVASLFVSANGNLGVGVISPEESLHLSGALRLGSTTTAVAGTMRWTGTAFEVSTANGQWTAISGTLIQDSSGLWTSGTGSDIYRENGNIAIGKTSSTSKLDIVGGVLVSETVTANKFSGDGSGLTNLAVYLTTANADARYVSANNSGGVTINGRLFVSDTVSANIFVGDGSALTGLAVYLVTTNADLRYKAISDAVGIMTANADARYVSQNHTGGVTIDGRLYVNNTVSANSFIGDGSGLAGLTVYLVTANADLRYKAITDGSGIITANADLRYVSANYSLLVTLNGLSVVNTINAGMAFMLNENANLGLLGNSGVIGFNYPDSTYDRRLRVTAGRDDTADNTQGASLDLHGVNHSTKPGDIDLVAGTGGGMSVWTSGIQRVFINTAGNIFTYALNTGTGTDLIIDSNNEIRKKSSSLRYKKDIKDIEIDTEKIFELRPVSFTWINQNIRDFGLIAEEVNATIPELVNYNAEGQIESVKYDQLTVLLLNEIKQLRERIEALEKK